MPSARFRHTASATKAPEEIWDRLQTVDSWANIGPVEDVRDPVHEDGALQGYRWSATVGPTTYDATAKVVESQRPHRMRLDLDAQEVVGVLLTEISANGDGTSLIAVTLDISSRGMLSTLFFPVISEAVGKGLPRQVEEFAASLEAE
jgi:hypothetical protein